MTSSCPTPQLGHGTSPPLLVLVPSIVYLRFFADHETYPLESMYCTSCLLSSSDSVLVACAACLSVWGGVGGGGALRGFFFLGFLLAEPPRPVLFFVVAPVPGAAPAPFPELDVTRRLPLPAVFAAGTGPAAATVAPVPAVGCGAVVPPAGRPFLVVM